MSATSRFSGDLNDAESFWRDHASWLQERGYQLRPRYQPDWKPSWLDGKKRSRFEYEDGHRAKEAGHLMDALRNLRRTHGHDQEGPRFLSVDDPHNHCVPIYEILQLPEDDHEYLIIMPFLTPWWPFWCDLPFSTIGEAVSFIRQLFEGVQLLHKNHIAHNGIKHDNIMVDSSPLYRRLMHPTEPRRSYDWRSKGSPRSITRHPVKYYFIDFDLCRQYNPQAGPARELPGYGGDRSVPEFEVHPEEPCDPFAVDVYRLGNFIRRFLMSSQQVFDDVDARDVKVNHAMEFMSGLVIDMTQEDPSKRPSIDHVVMRFEETVKGLSFFKLRSRFWPGFSRESFIARILWIIPRHFLSQVINVLGRYPAISPTPPPKGRRRG
ncbi:hypothetical protein K435DRAFT_969298 [Dendrothele bispora CBS 962.96]|uniref:Protein kinase domain-containing protein n=1 Tax=Dendrothele bispora (strain CBS 962.96) TaxID=1314807 RepID=A0A4S8LJZ3_DENBC|nr:hypothetical protein K435DRAFT_970491 [Dendrothele bispora CBS 962.96]THU88968.1 hypothetical protein K435DRAFT_969298 [Dendrothele bispora CBS 962.96]